MNIDIKDTLILDDKNEYVVVSKIKVKDKYYYYLVDIKNNENLKFCYQNDEELVELNDKELTTKLLPLFLEKANQKIKE